MNFKPQTLVNIALLAIVGLMCLMASQAKATTVADGAQPFQQWADTAQVPTPAATITVTVTPDSPDCGSGPGLGCISYPSDIYIAGWLTPAQQRSTYLHELGHLFAYLHPEVASSSDERFADGYSYCARRWHFERRWSLPAEFGAYSGRQLNRLCRVIRRGWSPPVSITVTPVG